MARTDDAVRPGRPRRRVVAGAGRVARAGAGGVRRFAHADGARESGLAQLLGASGLSSAGDALVAVALAGTVFFSVPLGEARGRVALYLLITLLPFSLLAPVAGPVLDRFRHGRRNVLAATSLLRALLAWSMATEVTSLALYPLALAVLVLSRAYGVGRSAATGRVRPAGLSLVAANARLNVAAVSCTALAAAVGAATAALAGPSWVLREAAIVLLVAAVLALRLPAHVDEARPQRGPRARRPRVLRADPRLLRLLLAAAGLRGVAGLLTVFLAFLLRAQGASTAVVGVVLGSAVAGQLLGTGLASRLSETATRRLTLAAQVLPALACAAAALRPEPAVAALAVGVTGVSYSLSKFALDAALQTHVPEALTSGAFARSETALQLSWAVGGAVGVALPAVAAAGFGSAAALPVLAVLLAVRATRGVPVPVDPLPGPARPGADPPTTARRPPAPRPYAGPYRDDGRAWWLDGS